MRGNPSWLVLGLGLCCTACDMGPQQKPVIAATPPPVIAKPAPVVVPQTVAELPNPQPVPPESIAARPPIEYKPAVKEVEAEPEAAQDTKQARQPAKTRPIRRPPAEATVPETVTPAPVPAEEPAAPSKLSAAGLASISREQLLGTVAEVQKILKEFEARPQSTANQATIARIQSFVRLAEQSASRNDLRQGDILAHRALALARDLAEPK